MIDNCSSSHLSGLDCSVRIAPSLGCPFRRGADLVALAMSRSKLHIDPWLLLCILPHGDNPVA